MRSVTPSRPRQESEILPSQHPLFDLMREVESGRIPGERDPQRGHGSATLHRLLRSWRRLTRLCMDSLEL